MNTVAERSAVPTNGDKLPPIPQRMYDLLSDGEEHTLEELFAILEDDLAKRHNVQPHLSVVRRHVALKDQTILCRGSRKDSETTYQLVNVKRIHPSHR